MDLPGLLFFSTYTLLVLFWAEIYHQARSLPTGSLRPAFLGLNAAVYAVQVRCVQQSSALNAQPAGAVLGRDLHPGPQPAHWQPQTCLPGPQRCRLCSAGALGAAVRCTKCTVSRVADCTVG